MEPVAAEICAFCQGLIPLREEPSIKRAHYSTLALLEQSSQSCSMCRILVNADGVKGWRKSEPTKAEHEAISFQVEVEEIHADSGLCWAILGTRCSYVDSDLVATFSISTCGMKSVNANQPIWKTAIISFPDKLSVLKDWLHDCELKHDRCKPPVVQMPRRVVMSHDLKKQSTSPIKYTTLSYCWGNANFRTTKENELLHRQELTYEHLPRTLQDAITVTRQLSIPYIWIDALCIVQDDPAEWEIESSKMRDVYLGSSLTIAASDAADVYTGCFPASFDGNGGLDPPDIFFISNIRDEGEFVIRLQSEDIRRFADGVVLNSRGWVLQEMVLSNRVVHCMKSGLYWECKCAYQTETGVKFDRSAVNENSLAILPHEAQMGTETNKIWWNWMESYSQRRFTFPTDRLPALAGITRYYQLATKDIPILGLWESTFHQDLLWSRVSFIPDGVPPIPNVIRNAPSWTWLSCPYEISFHHRLRRYGNDCEIQYHISLLEWAVNWDSEPLTSGINSTRLLLNGPVTECVLGISDEGKSFNPNLFNLGEKEGYHKPSRCHAYFDGASRSPPTKYLLMLGQTIIPKLHDWKEETCLILEPCSDIDTYRRVGIGVFFTSTRSSYFDWTNRRTLSLV
ncbi:hypothetical protein LARI1_G003076, partial [Lachnellula arida]